MQNVAMKVLELLGGSLASLVSKALSAVKLFFEWRRAKIELDEKKLEIDQAENREEAEKQKAKDFAEKAHGVATSGSVSDLLDLPRSACLAIVMCLVLAGCSTKPSVDVYTAKPWEGRYSTPVEFYRATRSVELDRGESVWVLSSRTLERVLVETRERSA